VDYTAYIGRKKKRSSWSTYPCASSPRWCVQRRFIVHLVCPCPVAEAGGLARAPTPTRKIFSSPSFEILTPFRVILLIWPPLIFFSCSAPVHAYNPYVTTTNPHSSSFELILVALKGQSRSPNKYLLNLNNFCYVIKLNVNCDKYWFAWLIDLREFIIACE